MTHLRRMHRSARRSRANSDPLPYDAAPGPPHPARTPRPASRSLAPSSRRTSLPIGMRPAVYSSRLSSRPRLDHESSSPSYGSRGAVWDETTIGFAGGTDEGRESADMDDDGSTLSSDWDDEEDNFPLRQHRPKVVPEFESRIIEFEGRNKTRMLSTLQRGYEHVQSSFETALDRTEGIIAAFAEVDGLKVTLNHFETANAKCRNSVESNRLAILSRDESHGGPTTKTTITTQADKQHHLFELQVPPTTMTTTSYEQLLSDLVAISDRIDDNLSTTRRALIEIQNQVEVKLDSLGRQFERNGQELAETFHDWAKGRLGGMINLNNPGGGATTRAAMPSLRHGGGDTHYRHHRRESLDRASFEEKKKEEEEKEKKNQDKGKEKKKETTSYSSSSNSSSMRGKTNMGQRGLGEGGRGDTSTTTTVIAQGKGGTLSAAASGRGIRGGKASNATTTPRREQARGRGEGGGIGRETLASANHDEEASEYSLEEQSKRKRRKN